MTSATCLSWAQLTALFDGGYRQAVSDAASMLTASGGVLDELCCAVRNVLVDVAFHLGPSRARKAFWWPSRSMLAAIAADDWAEAADSLRRLLWFSANGNRAEAHARTLAAGCAPFAPP